MDQLSNINQLLVHQEVQLLEVFTSLELNNKYAIKNSDGRPVFYAGENTSCCKRQLGYLRPFDMEILDNSQKEVIHLRRPFACSCCLFPCCLQFLEVSAPPGTVIGSVKQLWSLCKPFYAVKNAAGDVIFKIKGPFWTCSIGQSVDFNIYPNNSEFAVGKISKQWSGLARELFTNSDFFGITFPADLSVELKAVLLGACFLIDFMYYEKRD